MHGVICSGAGCAGFASGFRSRGRTVQQRVFAGLNYFFVYNQMCGWVYSLHPNTLASCSTGGSLIRINKTEEEGVGRLRRRTPISPWDA